MPRRVEREVDDERLVAVVVLVGTASRVSPERVAQLEIELSGSFEASELFEASEPSELSGDGG